MPTSFSLASALSRAGQEMAEHPSESDAESREVAGRLEEWRAYFRPADPISEWFLVSTVAASVRLDRCRTHETRLITHEMLRAEHGWDDDRGLEVEDLGARLATTPAKVARRLENSFHGNAWLARRWTSLAGSAAGGKPWTPSQRDLALDLLGTPIEFRDGPAPFDAADAPSPDLQAAFARGEVARLAARAGRLQQLDALARLSTAEGFPTTVNPALRACRSFEARNSREFHRGLAEIRRARLAAPAPAPVLAPEPRPITPPAPPAPTPAPAPAVSRPPVSDEQRQTVRGHLIRQLYSAASAPLDVSASEPEPESDPVPTPVRTAAAPAPAPARRMNRKARRALARKDLR